jgi:predicted phosphodiesterase
MTKRDIVRGYLLKFPSVASLTIARKIYKENVPAFKDLEDARKVVRIIRGSAGKYYRDTVKDQMPKINLPKSEVECKEPYILPKKSKNILVISDIHLPYHNETALKLALSYGIKNEVDTIIINGDLFDFHYLSRYEKDPNKRDVNFELQCAREFLAELRRLFPTQLIVFYMGNHDHRWNKYMIQKAPELMNISDFFLPSLLKLNDLKIIYRDNNRGWKAGKLNGRHGHEFQGGGGVYPARKYYLVAKDNILASHVHTTSEYIDKDINKDFHGGWTIGCLSDLDPDYNPFNRYNLGFARVQIVSDDGDFTIENKKIIIGKNGKGYIR